MICPLCELTTVDDSDDPDGAVRAICCNCEVLITITELTDKDMCEGEEII
jgi:hypothetical protein